MAIYVTSQVTNVITVFLGPYSVFLGDALWSHMSTRGHIFAYVLCVTFGYFLGHACGPIWEFTGPYLNRLGGCEALPKNYRK